MTVISGYFLDPTVPIKQSKGAQPEVSAITKLVKECNQVNFKIGDAAFAEKVFLGDKMVSVIPHTVNKKQFKQLTEKETVEFFKKMAQ